MAFNKAPSQSTYQTKDVSLMGTLSSRNQDATEDFVPVNGVFDIIVNKSAEGRVYNFVKREGTQEYPYTPPISGEIRGYHYVAEWNRFYIAAGDSLYITEASTGTLLSSSVAWTTTTGEVGFVDYQYSTGVALVMVTDGVRLRTISSAGSIGQITNPSLPTPILPSMVFLDGYLFVVKQGTADIYNCIQDDPGGWNPSDYITAEMSADMLKRISKTRNYLVAFGTNSIEYFYDAANASGSPLNRNDTPFKQVGYLGGLSNNESRLFFVGQAQGPAALPEVYVLEDFKIESLGTSPIQRSFQPYKDFDGTLLSIVGRDCYMVYDGENTFCVDIETGIWTKMSFGNLPNFPVKRSSSIYMPTIGHTTVVSLENSPKSYVFNPALFKDAGTAFPVKLRTDKQIFDTFHQKYMSRLMVVGDRPKTDADIQIRWTDDDYQTFSPYRVINLNQEFPAIHRLGRFRMRAFDLLYEADAPLRLHHLEVDFNIGAK